MECVLTVIISYVDDIRDLCALIFVCKDWYNELVIKYTDHYYNTVLRAWSRGFITRSPSTYKEIVIASLFRGEFELIHRYPYGGSRAHAIEFTMQEIIHPQLMREIDYDGFDTASTIAAFTQLYAKTYEMMSTGQIRIYIYEY